MRHRQNSDLRQHGPQLRVQRSRIPFSEIKGAQYFAADHRALDAELTLATG